MLFLKKILLCLTFVIFIINSGESLKCYVCSIQEQKNDKCMDIIKTCEPGEDTCVTEIRNGSWVIKEVKKTYITKRCSRKKICKQLKIDTMKYCKKSSDRNWMCAECCYEDKCNNFVAMGSSAVKSNLLMLIGCVTILIGFHVIL